MEVRGLILTVGGSPAPIEYSIASHRPERVVFVVSRESAAQIGDIQRNVSALREILGAAAADPVYDFEQADSAVSIEAVEAAVRKAIARLIAAGLSRDEIRIDFTGGTKVMSAAAVLAGTAEGLGFAYIDGARRDKGGLGVVVEGEFVLPAANPWADSIDVGLNRAIESAAAGAFRAAIAEVERLRARSPLERRPLLEVLRKALEALHLWDRFDHTAAWIRLGGVVSGDAASGRKPAGEAHLARQLHDLALSGGKPAALAFAQRLSEVVPRLRDAVAALDSPPGEGPDPVLADLVANADRRASDGDLDESAVRLYRAVELLATRRLEAKLGVRPPLRKEHLPARLQAAYSGYVKTGGLLKMSLHQQFVLLKELGDSCGSAFHQEGLDGDLRHESWLIHGLGHVKESELSEFRARVMRVAGLGEDMAKRAGWSRLGEKGGVP